MKGNWKFDHIGVIVRDVDAAGVLVLEDADGALHRIFSGDIILKHPEGA